MSQGMRMAAVLALTAVATVVEAASAPALGVAPVSTPTVTTPSVTVPPVNTPVVTTPSVSVPPASAPKVTTPSVSAPPAAPPKVSAPKVTAPKVSTPQVSAPKVSNPKSGSGPSSSAPKTLVPSVSVGGGGSGSGGSGGGGVVNTVRPLVPTVSGGGLRGATTQAVGGAAGGGYAAPGSSNSALAPLFGGGPGGPAGGGPAAPGGFAGFAGPGGFGGGPGSPLFTLGLPVLGKGSGGVTAFAAAVGALAGCFYALSPYEQQVLTERTGIDGRQALSRPQVAALLGTSSKAVAHVERGALGRLRAAAATEGCMPLLAGGPANALTAFIGGPFGPVGVVTAALPPTARVNPAPSGERLASTSIADRLAGLPNNTDQASLSILLVIAVMLSGALAALLFEARRQVH
jgi:hypothetical protein